MIAAISPLSASVLAGDRLSQRSVSTQVSTLSLAKDKSPEFGAFGDLTKSHCGPSIKNREGSGQNEAKRWVRPDPTGQGGCQKELSLLSGAKNSRSAWEWPVPV